MNVWQRFLLYTFGILLLTFGIALTVQAHLGTSPFDALLVGLYRTFGLTIGSWEIVVGFAMVICNAFALRQRPEYLALLTSLITGMGIDFWLFIISDWVHPDTLIVQVICLLIGMIFVGLGIAVNLQSNFAPNPMDRSMLVVTKLTGWNVAVSRALINIILVIAAFLFSGPIGFGTIITALFTGHVIKFFMPYTARLEKRKAAPSECASL